MSQPMGLDASHTSQELCMTLRSAPYRSCDDQHKPSADGGVLAAGTQVWAPTMPSAVRRARAVHCFVDGIGSVLIDGKLLRRLQA